LNTKHGSSGNNSERLQLVTVYHQLTVIYTSLAINRIISDIPQISVAEACTIYAANASVALFANVQNSIATIFNLS